MREFNVLTVNDVNAVVLGQTLWGKIRQVPKIASAGTSSVTQGHWN